MNNNKLSTNKSGLMGLYYEGVNRVCLYIGKWAKAFLCCVALDLIFLNH